MAPIVWIIFGALFGLIASSATKTDVVHGRTLNIVVGIAGATIGGSLMSIIAEGNPAGFNFYSFVVAIIGAAVCLTGVRVLRSSD